MFNPVMPIFFKLFLISSLFNFPCAPLMPYQSHKFKKITVFQFHTVHKEQHTNNINIPFSYLKHTFMINKRKQLFSHLRRIAYAFEELTDDTNLENDLLTIKQITDSLWNTVLMKLGYIIVYLGLGEHGTSCLQYILIFSWNIARAETIPFSVDSMVGKVMVDA